MKRIHTFAGLVAAAAVLSACGGGGAAGGPDQAPIGPAALTVSAMVAPTITTADCPQLMDESAAIAALDLSNRDIKTLNDYLVQMDREHAYKVFLRRPADFVNWIASSGGKVNLVNVGVATHETLHMTDTVLRGCSPDNAYKTLQFGTILITGLMPGDTANMSIVDGVLDPSLKTAQRYGVYIKNAAAGNDFTVLLDEFSAYAGAAHTDYKMIANGAVGDAVGTLDLNIGGTVNFMVFLETYLKAARLSSPTTYDNIRNNPQTVATIQALWSRAEQVLTKSYAMTTSFATPQLVVDSTYFKAAYSDDLLGELDAIGVTHAPAVSWSATYLK